MYKYRFTGYLLPVGDSLYIHTENTDTSEYICFNGHKIEYPNGTKITIWFTINLHIERLIHPEGINIDFTKKFKYFVDLWDDECDYSIDRVEEVIS